MTVVMGENAEEIVPGEAEVLVIDVNSLVPCKSRGDIFLQED
jgi:hypothetical protein